MFKSHAPREYRLLTRPQGHHDLRPFRGGEQQSTGPLRRRQEPAVGRDQRELPIIGEGQMADPRS
jgi:hypothetical protein